MQYHVYIYNAIMETIRTPEDQCDWKWVNCANDLGLDRSPDQQAMVLKTNPDHVIVCSGGTIEQCKRKTLDAIILKNMVGAE